MYLIGRGRYARSTYPVAGQTAALTALSNRYLIDPIASPAIPSAFTATSPTTHIVAAVNVARRASGIFMVSVQMPAELAALDTQAWVALALFGSTASGGVPAGDWLADVAAPITTSPPTGSFPMSIYEVQSDAGNLLQSVTLVGVNAAPMPQGPSTIIIAGTTVAGTLITPRQFFGVVFEMP